MKSATRDSGRLHSQTFRDQGCWGLCGGPMIPQVVPGLGTQGPDEGRKKGTCCEPATEVSRPLSTGDGCCLQSPGSPATCREGWKHMHPYTSPCRSANTNTLSHNPKGAAPNVMYPVGPLWKSRDRGIQMGLSLPRHQVQTWEATESRKAQQFMQQRPQKGGKAILKPWLREG